MLLFWLKKLYSRQELRLAGLIMLLLIPTFWRMLRVGIFTMHDFHVFRLSEYDKCIADWQLPCRWAPDAAFGYGQPMFNFYAQFPYIFGEFFRLLGFSVLDSIKALFIASIILSAIGMYLLSRQLWGNSWGAMVSAMVYSYAPYRAVDIYVRGALPEALSFIFFPFITFFFNAYIQSKKFKYVLIFSLLFAGLILTHNLSALMYSIFLLVWGLLYIYKNQAFRLAPKFIFVGILGLGITAFYVLPVAFESKLVSLGKTTAGYYDYHHHFVSIKQLLISRYWGYGGSLWGDDDRLSLSVGHVQWILPVLILAAGLILRKVKNLKAFLILLLAGWFMLFLTHMKSSLLWEKVPGISFVQFPWRFLGSAVFAFALAGGAIAFVLRGRLLKLASAAIIFTVIALNANFYKEDIWLNLSDQEFFSGINFDDQRASAVDDFWPIYGNRSPRHIAPDDPVLVEGSGSASLVKKGSKKLEYQVNLSSQEAIVQFPAVYFPGWTGESGKKLDLYPSGEFGLITAKLTGDDGDVALIFRDTPVRVAGNIISLLSFGLWALLYLRWSRHE